MGPEGTLTTVVVLWPGRVGSLAANLDGRFVAFKLVPK